jgi:hypothetical protein
MIASPIDAPASSLCSVPRWSRNENPALKAGFLFSRVVDLVGVFIGKVFTEVRLGAMELATQAASADAGTGS